MALNRKKQSKAAPAGLIAGATGAAGAIAAYALRRRRRGQDAEPPASGSTSPAPAAEDATAPSRPEAATTPAVAPEALNTAPHDAGEAVIPDMSSDPLVDEQTNAAAAQAGSIGGNVDAMAAADPAFPQDPAMRAVEEASGDSEESFEAGTEEVGR